MNRDQVFKVQAYLDGELTRSEAAKLEEGWLTTEAGNRLLEELRWTKDVLGENPPLQSVPETREFYWSRIERGIISAEATPPRSNLLVMDFFRRWLAPASGAALVCLLVLLAIQLFEFSPAGTANGQLARVESPSDAMDSFSFENKAEKVFVIWLYERPSEPKPEWNYVKDLMIQ